MLLTMMKSKLHRATVTQADLDYEGSIAIDRDLLDASGILPHEQVDVLNITNGARFTTYAIEAPRGSKVFGVNGAAARLVQKGDKIIVVTYGQLPAEEARNYNPVVVLLDDQNDIKRAAYGLPALPNIAQIGPPRFRRFPCAPCFPSPPLRHCWPPVSRRPRASTARPCPTPWPTRSAARIPAC